jgi:hypothetical protein
MRQGLRITNHGRHSAGGTGDDLGSGDAAASGSSGGDIIRRGESFVVLNVASLSVIATRNGQTARWSLGPFSRGHEAHRRLRPGDTLVVVTETRPDGRTEVELPACRCRAMIWKD